MSDPIFVSKLMAKSPLFFSKNFIHVLPWDPLFDVNKGLIEACPVWVQFVDLVPWLWPALGQLADQLDRPLFIPSTPAMGKASNKVCITWDTRVSTPKSMAVSLGNLGTIEVKLSFGAFAGACFQCGSFGHFARQCPGPWDVREEGCGQADVGS